MLFRGDTRSHAWYLYAMKDQRVAFVRRALSELVESLDASMRVGRWSGADSVPAPLAASAALLVERLGKANRLAADKFTGPPRVVETISAMSTAIRQLDVAFVAYSNSP